MSRYRWSVTVLTIPERAEYLRRLLISLNNTVLPGNLEVVVIYNARARDSQVDIERTIQGHAPRLKVGVYFNSQDRSIAGGRNFQLNLCKGDLICFVDDDVTLHGPVFPTLEQALRDQSVGLVGLRSFVNGTEDQFKPRRDTPYVDRGAFRFMPVQGVLCAGYRELFNDVGGFNPRRRFWGEWTEFNLRMWRMGYPTGYAMTGGFLRHWLEAPSSPTRSMAGREANVLWGLICTAIEYDAVDVNQATEAFWRLVEERYLSYSFGDALTPRTLLRTTLELMPMLSAEWSAIARHKEAVARHPFPFKPFQALSDEEVDAVLEVSSRQIQPYRAPIFSTGPATTWVRRLFRLWRTEPRPRRSPVGAQAAQAGDEPFRN